MALTPLDFPPSPPIGTIYPNPAVAGQPQYTYDGEKWSGGAGVGNVYISDSPPAAPVGSLWWESDTGILYVNFNDGTSIQWVAIPGGPSDAVRYGAQTLTTREQVQARKNIFAAPFDALAYSGMQINGSIDVLQQGGGEISVNGYQADGWLMSASGSLATRLGRTAEIPGVGGATITGFNYHLYLYATTAKASLTTTDQVRVSHYIEGWRSSRLRWGTASAVPLTIAFWSNHDYAGTYSVGIRNAPVTHSCVMSYTHSVAGVAQYNVLTFPACTLGAWDSSNGAGLDMSFVVGCGPTFTAPSTGSWISGNYFSAPGQVNGVAATDKFFRITGLTVLPGIEAPTAARSPLIMRPYDQELVTCQRYWRTFLPMGAGLAATTAEARFQIQHHGMRAAPTPTVSAAVTISNIGTSNYTQSSPHMTWISGGADGGEYNFGNFAGMSVAAALIFRAGAGVVRFDARL